MEKLYIKFHHIDKYVFKNKHGINDMQYFKNPCIGYLLKGRGDFLYKGKKYTAFEGDLIYIAKGTRYYSVWSGNPDIEFYSVGFSYYNPYDMNDRRFQIVKSFKREYFDKMYERYKKEDLLASNGYFYLMMSELIDKLEETPDTYYLKSIEPAIKYINENLCEKVSVSELSRMCGLSESRFHHLFKDITGNTPIEYKNNLIIEEALRLLYETDMTIENISEELNFSSPAFFRRIFKGVTGKNPKDIRKNKTKKYM